MLQTILVSIATIALVVLTGLTTIEVVSLRQPAYESSGRFYTGEIKERPELTPTQVATSPLTTTTNQPITTTQIQTPSFSLPAGIPIPQAISDLGTTIEDAFTQTPPPVAPELDEVPEQTTEEEIPVQGEDPVTEIEDPLPPPPIPPPPAANGQLVFIDPIIPSRFTWNPSDVFANPPSFSASVQALFEPAPIPDLEQLIPLACEVNPQNFTRDIFNDPNCQYFNVLAGNYDIDEDRIEITRSGTAAAPRVIFFASERPWDLPASQRATFAGFDIEASHIYIMNLEFYGNNSTASNGNTYNKGSRQTSGGHVVWHGNYARNSAGLCRCYSDYNTFQFNLVDDRPDVPFDIGGVAISALSGQESRGNRVLYNEIIGQSDGIGVPRDGTSLGSTPATVIAYNYSWIPESLYQYNTVTDTTTGETQTQVTACAEDGYDFKNGSLGLSAADRSYFVYNISRGHRVTDQSCGGSGSSGAGWIFHNWTKNWDAAGNLSYDDAHGVFLKNVSDDGIHNVERVYMYKNVWAHLPSTYPGGLNGERVNENDGLALRTICEQDCKIYDNLIYNVQTDSLWSEAENNTPITNNTLVNVATQNLVNQNVPVNPPVKNVFIAESPLKDPGATIRIELTTVN